jgi:hypothetical protein
MILNDLPVQEKPPKKEKTRVLMKIPPDHHPEKKPLLKTGRASL